MNKFVYVFSNKAKELMLSRGYELLKEDDLLRRYAFVNKQGDESVATFSVLDDAGLIYVQTDVLTF